MCKIKEKYLLRLSCSYKVFVNSMSFESTEISVVYNCHLIVDLLFHYVIIMNGQREGPHQQEMS